MALRDFNEINVNFNNNTYENLTLPDNIWRIKVQVSDIVINSSAWCHVDLGTASSFTRIRNDSSFPQYPVSDFFGFDTWDQLTKDFFINDNKFVTLNRTVATSLRGGFYISRFMGVYNYGGPIRRIQIGAHLSNDDGPIYTNITSGSANIKYWT